MSTPAEVVADAFSTAQIYASEAEAKLTSFAAALEAAQSPETLIDVTWEAVAAPPATSTPSRPGALEELEGEFDWDQDGSIDAAKPLPLDEVAPTVDIDNFTEPDPTVDFGDAPTLTFDSAPVLSIGTAPSVPTVADITVPDAPSVTLPDTPTYLSLSTPTFAGVDLNDAFLENLEEIPTLNLVAPTPYSYAPGAEYESALLTALKAALLTRIAGGTGLSSAVETAIWDRARDRDAAAAQANVDDILRSSEALGFSLPSGVTAAQVRKAEDDFYRASQSASREIAIKQAELELANIQQTISQSMQLEGVMIDNAYKMELLAFENAKTYAANAIEVYNAQVGQFQALVQAYGAYATAYRSIIDGQLAKVEVFKAQVQAELSKAEVNRTLVQQYEAEVRARLAAVEVFRAQVEGAKALVEVEQAKVSAAGEAIRAYVAGINGETAKVEAYKVSVQAQGAQVEAYKAGVDAKLATVQVFKAKADAFSAKANAQAEKAKAKVAHYQALVQAKASEWDGWRARVQAETARFQALAVKSNSALDGYRADIARYTAVEQAAVGRWSAQIRQYEAQQTYSISALKLNSDIIRYNNDAIRESAKVGAQVYAQLTASAYGMIRASAGVSAGASNTVSYSYSNQTTSAPSSVTAV